MTTHLDYDHRPDVLVCLRADFTGTLTPVAGSIQINCQGCHSKIWVGPASQAFLEDLRALCTPCAWAEGWRP